MLVSSTHEGTVTALDRTGTVHIVDDPASRPHQAEASPPLPDEPLRAWLWLLLAGRDGV
jgi:hypothetical protein